MEWLNKLLGIKGKGKFECVFIKKGEWKVKYGDSNKDSYDEYCQFQIFHNSVTNEFKLETEGYKATSHSLYEEMFATYRCLQEGESYVRGGKIYPHTNKNIHRRPKE